MRRRVDTNSGLRSCQPPRGSAGWLAVVVAVASAGCWMPTVDTHCQQDGDCPTDYRCEPQQRLCVHLLDAATAIADARTSDRAPADTTPGDLQRVDAGHADRGGTDTAAVDTRRTDARVNDATCVCNILENCHDYHERRTDNPCQWCEPAAATDQWSPFTGAVCSGWFFYRCLNGTIDRREYCDADRCEEAIGCCGGFGESCCTVGTRCDYGGCGVLDRCANLTHCGTVGNACCPAPSTSCTSGECGAAGSCQDMATCGTVGNACCPAPDAACANGDCNLHGECVTSCGGEYENCCLGDLCDGTLTCCRPYSPGECIQTCP